MNQPDRIHLRDHVVAAEIGAFQSERGQTQRLRFALTVDLRDPVDAGDDHVDRILSYDVLVQAVDAALADQRYNLVETLAERIAAEVLAHPQAARIEVCVEKLDRGPGALGITISRDAGRVAVARQHLRVRIVVGQPAALPTGAVILLPAAPALPLPQGGDARRIALLGLDQAAWILAQALGVEVAETRTELDAAIRDERPVVWAPARLAVEAPATAPEAPALAFWLAPRLAADRIDFAADAPPAPDGLAIPVGRIPGAAE
ncbi:dihydroneopterin aldolase [Paracoccus shandongensis]|uniref:dihydroneopterin aldolase n=1 Tax=Paracoccus shandongensis TaxID=2816048 RepID=UPI001A8CB3E6|nr:dihydroneopterin aldolase [Paracoccus shandongensis]